MFGRKRKDDAEMSFLDHLEVLRWHIIRSLLSIGLFAILAFIFKSLIFDHLILAPKNPNFITNRLFCELGKYLGMMEMCINQRSLQLININLSGQFSTHVTVSIYTGFLVAFPYVVWEFWRFIKPALYPNERRHTRGAVFFISVLFTIGVLFGYYIISPISIEFFGGYAVSADVKNQINLDSYIVNIASTVLACGVIFELPMFIYFLSKVGLITPPFLKRYRRHAFVIILAVAAVITPPDVFSQIIVSIPLIILYESGIIISGRVLKNKAKRELKLISD